MELPADLIERIRELRTSYRDARAVALPALELLQARFGFVTPDQCEALGALLEVPGVKLWETATFYTMIRRAPEGRFRISVCRSVACDLMRSRDLVDHLMRTLGVAVGGTTADGRFSLQVAECLGACGAAPVVAVNDTEYHENMDAAKADALVAALKARA